MNFCRSTDDAHCHRHFQQAYQVTIVTLGPGRQAGIAARSRGVSVRSGLDGAPVVAGGHHHRVDAVHDALVVRGGAVGIGCSKRPGLHDAIAHLFAAESSNARASKGMLTRARASLDPPGWRGCAAAPARRSVFQPAGQVFQLRVDRVGAHRVAHVHDQVQHEESTDGGIFDDAHLNIAWSAAKPG